MRYSMVIVTSGLLPYDKLIAMVRELEKDIDEQGGNDSVQLTRQEWLKSFLNGEGETIQ